MRGHTRTKDLKWLAVMLVLALQLGTSSVADGRRALAGDTLFDSGVVDSSQAQSEYDFMPFRSSTGLRMRADKDGAVRLCALTHTTCRAPAASPRLETPQGVSRLSPG